MYYLFFVLNVFNEPFISQVHIASNYTMLMRNELKKMWKEAHFTWFLEVVWYLHEGTETHVETSGRITDLRTKFWTWNLQKRN
jgi:hypothetical protein